MSTPAPRSPVVIDTGVFGANLLERTARLADLYRPILTGRPALISFQTETELRFGALRRGWGAPRMLKLEACIATAEIVHSDAGLVAVHAGLRADCERAGHALAQREHNADRWVAATAIHLGVSLVAHDGIFADVPGLILETVLGT